MARIRTVKPETFSSYALHKVCIEARFLFIGMFTEADDDGRLIDSPRRLAGALFPHDVQVTPEQVSEWLDQLVSIGVIGRYSAGQGKYLVLPGWEEHQRISHRTPSKFPEPPEKFRRHSGKTPINIPQEQGTGNREQGTGNREQGTGKHDEHARSFESDFDEAWEEYPRKMNRGRALKAYVARRKAGAVKSDLLTATQNYAKYVAGTEQQFIKHGSTFFGPDEPFRDFLHSSSPEPTGKRAGNHGPVNRSRRDIALGDIQGYRNAGQDDLADELQAQVDAGDFD